MRRALAPLLVLCGFLSPTSCALAPARAADPAPAPVPAGDRADAPRRRAATSGQVLPAPMFWTWQEPLGAARGRPNIVQMVRVKTHLEPQAAADSVCREIVKRNLRPGQVCIVLQNFGMGGGDPAKGINRSPALFKHWDDALPRGSVNGWWLTVWMDHGIQECRAWTERFIAQYKTNQAKDPRISDPSRFHFDSEGSTQPQRRRQATMPAFDRMRKDPRWSRKIIPGNGGKTLARLYAEAGSPSYDMKRPGGDPANLAWLAWYARVANQACEGAMDTAAYQPIRRAWRKCLSSNYGTSARYDGGGSPPRLRPTPRQPAIGFATDAFGDLQAPVLYWASPEAHQRTGGSVEDATFAKAKAVIDANRMSFEGPHRDITPWLPMIGHSGDQRGRDLTMSKAFMKRLLRMLKEKGVQEFILWSDKSTQRSEQNWNDLVALSRELWR